MLILPINILAIVALVIVLGGIAGRNPKLLLLASVLFWVMAIGSVIPIVWAWTERSHSENWAFSGVFFVSFPLILALLILRAVLLRHGGTVIAEPQSRLQSRFSRRTRTQQ